MSKIEKYHIKRDKMRMMMPLLSEQDREHIGRICRINSKKVTEVLSGREWDEYEVCDTAAEIAVMRIEDFRKDLVRMKRWLRSK